MFSRTIGSHMRAPLSSPTPFKQQNQNTATFKGRDVLLLVSASFVAGGFFGRSIDLNDRTISEKKTEKNIVLNIIREET